MTEIQSQEERRAGLPIDFREEWTYQDLYALTLSQLRRVKTEVDYTADQIEIQLERAKHERKAGKEVDSDWYWNAVTAYKAFKRKRQLVPKVLSDKERAVKDFKHKKRMEAEKEDKKFRHSHWFKEVARANLDEETYYEWCEIAQNRRDEYEEENMEEVLA